MSSTDGNGAGPRTDQIERSPKPASAARLPRSDRPGLLENVLVRRLLMGGAVLVAIGCFVVAGFVADTDSDDGVSVSGDVVERLIPTEDFAVLQQNPVGVDLAPGWGVSNIAVNGIDVPENEWDVTPDLGLYQVMPTDGQTLEQLLAQENCVEVVAFELLDPTSTETIDWCFTAT